MEIFLCYNSSNIVVLMIGGVILIEATRYIGCLLGGAVGDALGYPVEFMSYPEIVQAYGKRGITDLAVSESGKALISDDTQMTLFTAEGLIWAKRVEKKNGYCNIAARCFYSYQRWLHTQDYPLADSEYQWVLDDKRLDIRSPLLKRPELFARRAPGTTCLQALMDAKEQNYGTIEEPINNSKGCGGVMRVAPVGLGLYSNPKKAYEIGCQVAAITHSHPTGFISAGAFASLIAHLLNGKTILDAVLAVINQIAQVPGGQETLMLLRQAVDLYQAGEPSLERLSSLGQGFVAEEALAIAVYAALCYSENLKRAVIFAVNHDGDSDSTGSICGNIVGAYLGKSSVPQEWLANLECEDVIEDMGLKLFEAYNLDRYRY